MSERDRQMRELLLASPAWQWIVDRARTQIEKAKLAALANDDEVKFLELYRKAHAAQEALREFVDELEDEVSAVEIKGEFRSLDEYELSRIDN